MGKCYVCGVDAGYRKALCPKHREEKKKDQARKRQEMYKSPYPLGKGRQNVE